MASTNAGGSGRARRGAIVGINVTPMVDVVLVLLVIMMVSATYIVSQSIHVELPRAANGDGAAASSATVTITRARALFYDQQPVSEAQLLERLRRAHDANGALSVIVTADRNASHGSVMHVIDLARGLGITSFAISVEQGS